MYFSKSKHSDADIFLAEMWVRGFSLGFGFSSDVRVFASHTTYYAGAYFIYSFLLYLVFISTVSQHAPVTLERRSMPYLLR